MKALMALSLFICLASCTKREGKGGAAADDTNDSATETTDSVTGSGKENPDDEDGKSKNDKDVEKDSDTTPHSGGSSDTDDTDSGSTSIDTDLDGITDDHDVCPGEDDALQVTRYKLVDADQDSHADGALSAKVCPSNTEYTLTQVQAVSSDCDSSDATKWQMLAYSHRDADGDGHSVASPGSICTGSALPTGYLSSALGTTDCDDSNSSYHTTATYYAYNEDAVTTDRYSRVSALTCVPADGYGSIDASKEYRLVPDVISSSGLASIGNFYEFGGKLYFKANNGTNGSELWKTDGTSGGASLVKDINPGTDSSSPANFMSAAGTLFFTAYDGAGVHLWKTDGTEAGTVKVKAVTPTLLTAVGGSLYFVTSNPLYGEELWKSDGTEAGTVMVKDIYPDSDSSSPTNLTNVNGTLFFVADDGNGDRDLWKSDGTDSGTVKVKDLNSASPMDLTAVGETLFFTASLSAYGRELWKSDGTEAGTTMVKDIRVGNSPGIIDNGSSYFAAVNGLLYFRADNAVSGIELWKSDGTEAGTTMVKDILAGPSGSMPENLLAVNGTLYFTATDGTTGSELWKSNGTDAGTVLVKDIRSGDGITIMFPTAVGSILYFRTDDGIHGSELWKSDGTETGTILVKDINPNGSNSSNPVSLRAFGNQLVFVATTLEGSRAHITPLVLP